MPYTLAELDREIETKIEALKKMKLYIHADFLTTSILSDHKSLSGNDADFFLVVARKTIREAVRARINKTDSLEKTSAQLSLEGFKHLHDFYLVLRRDSRGAIAIEDMTDDEFDSKADEYEAMGQACIAHANELRRYKDDRRAKRERAAA